MSESLLALKLLEKNASPSDILATFISTSAMDSLLNEAVNNITNSYLIGSSGEVVVASSNMDSNEV